MPVPGLRLACSSGPRTRVVVVPPIAIVFPFAAKWISVAQWRQTWAQFADTMRRRLCIAADLVGIRLDTGLDVHMPQVYKASAEELTFSLVQAQISIPQPLANLSELLHMLL